MALSIHTVLLIREHILFLEEWIAYHLSIGFTKIYLYDNSRSLGNEDYNSETNKYHYDYKKITASISEEALNARFSALLQKYSPQLICVNWEPLNGQGQITYGQHRAIKDYIRRADRADWTAFIDLDEFIYSRYRLPEYIQQCEAAGVGDITLQQKKFDDRFNNLHIPVSRITACVEGLDTLSWGPKHIIKNQFFNTEETAYWNVHLLPTENCQYLIANSSDLRFNHYNFNEKQKAWMKDFYHSPVDHALNGSCYDLFNAVSSSPSRDKIWAQAPSLKAVP